MLNLCRHCVAVLILMCCTAMPALAEEAKGRRGIVVPARSWDISPAIDGKIVAIHFSESQILAKDDLLLELDDTATRLELDLARAQLELKLLELRQADEDFGRQQQLKERDAVSGAAFSDALFAKAMAEHAVKIAELEVQVVKSRLAAQRVYAPADGIISAPALARGTNFNLVESSAVARLVVLDPIHVRAPVQMEQVLDRLEHEEFDASRTLDISIEILLPNGTPYPLRGRVASVGFELDPDTGEGSVLVEFDNPKGLLRPGMPVRVIAHAKE